MGLALEKATTSNSPEFICVEVGYDDLSRLSQLDGVSKLLEEAVVAIERRQMSLEHFLDGQHEKIKSMLKETGQMLEGLMNG